MTMSDKNPYFNQSGCADPTAHDALEPIIKDDAELEKKVHELTCILRIIAGLAGFEVLNRIQIKDRKSGRIFR